jgi:CBS domain containing-hemolysin-like protein
VIALSIFLLACAAVYLGSIEAAFSALMRLSLRLVAERSDRPGALGTYLDDPVLLFVPVRLLLGLVTGVATALLARALGVEGADKLPVIVAGVAGFVIVCELLLPLLIVARDPEKVLELLLPTFAPVARILKPFTLGISRLMATKRPSPAVTPAESDEEATEVAKAYIDTAEQEGIIQGEERQLLRSIVDFGDTLVREVMTPRPDIVAVKDDATIATVRALFREQEYSRFPVYRDSLDNISGFIFIKDLWGLPPTALEDQPIKPLVRPLVVVPETKQVSELLKQFQRQQTQCAIVVDEYGGTAGLVTLEDLLEEIVGEIRDEYDVESEPIVDEGRGRFVFSGKVNIDEVAQRLEVEIEREGFETVGGFLMHHIGRVPQVGEKFDIEDVTVEVLDAERRRINRVRMCKRSARPSQEEQTA